MRYLLGLICFSLISFDLLALPPWVTRARIISSQKIQNGALRQVIRSMKPSLPANFSGSQAREMGKLMATELPSHVAVAWTAQRKEIADLIRAARRDEYLTLQNADTGQQHWLRREEIPRSVSDEDFSFIVSTPREIQFRPFAPRLTEQGWDVSMTSTVLSQARNLPHPMKERLETLFNIMRTQGPRAEIIGQTFTNYQKTAGGLNNFHCHLGNCGGARFVAYWDQLNSHLIEPTFFGTHEAANKLRGGY